MSVHQWVKSNPTHLCSYVTHFTSIPFWQISFSTLFIQLMNLFLYHFQHSSILATWCSSDSCITQYTVQSDDTDDQTCISRWMYVLPPALPKYGPHACSSLFLTVTLMLHSLGKETHALFYCKTKCLPFLKAYVITEWEYKNVVGAVPSIGIQESMPICKTNAVI